MLAQRTSPRLLSIFIHINQADELTSSTNSAFFTFAFLAVFQVVLSFYMSCELSARVNIHVCSTALDRFDQPVH